VADGVEAGVAHGQQAHVLRRIELACEHVAFSIGFDTRPAFARRQQIQWHRRRREGRFFGNEQRARHVVETGRRNRRSAVEHRTIDPPVKAIAHNETGRDLRRVCQRKTNQSGTHAVARGDPP
jgi:hypothetical protein